MFYLSSISEGATAATAAVAGAAVADASATAG